LEAELRRCPVRRTLSLVLLVTLIALVPASAASGGGNWLEFREDPRAGASLDDSSAGDGTLGTWAVLHVGQRVVAATSVYATDPRRRHLENEGPFYAWLIPEGSFRGETRLPESAIRLAPFGISWSSKRFAHVRAHLTVPSVPSGKYEVIVCNEPCTFPGFGEYVQGWVTVMQTPDEARLLAVARERKWKGRELAQKVKHLQGEVDALGAEVAAAGTELHERALEARAAETRMIAVEAERDASAPTKALVPGWAAVAIAVALVSGAVIVRRRRLPSFDVPDTVPDDLLERDRVDL
jgi:hypothetical protein